MYYNQRYYKMDNKNKKSITKSFKNIVLSYISNQLHRK